MKTKKNIFWDFDGVILNSNDIRTHGFRKVLENYPKHEVEQLIDYHITNGGLSRYHKFRYFFEKILNITITEEEVKTWAKLFSKMVLEQLLDKNLLIEENINYIKENYKSQNMHIVSGSDGEELRCICNKLEIDMYFLSIDGSPTPKNELVSSILIQNNYNKDKCILIGDSINDEEAALINGIEFKFFKL